MVTYKNLGKNGRLGNQLWQIASTIGIARKNGQPYSFPEWEYEKHFENFKSYPTERLKGHRFNVYNELNSYYQDIVLSSEYNWDLNGYFQSWKYFKDFEAEVRDFLYFQKPQYEGVAVHVRRGDYLRLQHIHPVLSLNYYLDAMALFKGEVFTVFSDDITWCRENLKGQEIQCYPIKDDIHDFKAMCGFSKFVIANSSYSWWAAWLSGSTKIVAPATWVTTENRDDRVPPEWVRL